MAAEIVSENGPATVGVTRLRWFPLSWTILVVGGCVLTQLGNADQDVKNFSILLGTGVLFLGLSAWTLFGSGYAPRKRFTWALAPWAVALLFWSTVEIVNNGDVAIVGWRWRWGAKPDEQLEVLVQANQEIAEWQTTPHDYPRFLGKGYWAEVADMELATDW